MRRLVRRLAPLVAAVTMAGGITLASATTASASGWGCSGSEVSGSPYPVQTVSGVTYSYVHLFWDGSTGKNCAVNVKTGVLYGASTYVDVTLYECYYDVTGSPCGDYPGPNPLVTSDDYGGYYYYAGPVSVPGSGHCVRVKAETDGDGVGGLNDIADFDSGAFHC